MSKTASVALVLGAVAIASLSAAVAGYEAVFTDATGAVTKASAKVDATSITCSLDAGTYVPTVVCVDANGAVITNADGTPIVITGPTDPIVIAEPTTVNIPLSFTVQVA